MGYFTYLEKMENIGIRTFFLGTVCLVLQVKLMEINSNGTVFQVHTHSMGYIEVITHLLTIY